MRRSGQAGGGIGLGAVSAYTSSSPSTPMKKKAEPSRSERQTMALTSRVRPFGGRMRSLAELPTSRGASTRPDLGAHGAQVHGLELEVTVSDLEDYRPCNLGPRVPPEIGPASQPCSNPLCWLGILSPEPRLLQAPFVRGHAFRAIPRRRGRRAAACSLFVPVIEAAGADRLGFVVARGYELEEAATGYHEPRDHDTPAVSSALMRTLPRLARAWTAQASCVTIRGDPPHDPAR